MHMPQRRVTTRGGPPTVAAVCGCQNTAGLAVTPPSTRCSLPRHGAADRAAHDGGSGSRQLMCRRVRMYRVAPRTRSCGRLPTASRGPHPHGGCGPICDDVTAAMARSSPRPVGQPDRTTSGPRPDGKPPAGTTHHRASDFGGRSPILASVGMRASWTATSCPRSSSIRCRATGQGRPPTPSPRTYRHPSTGTSGSPHWASSPCSGPPWEMAGGWLRRPPLCMALGRHVFRGTGPPVRVESWPPAVMTCRASSPDLRAPVADGTRRLVTGCDQHAVIGSPRLTAISGTAAKVFDT